MVAYIFGQIHLFEIDVLTIDGIGVFATLQYVLSTKRGKHI